MFLRRLKGNLRLNMLALLLLSALILLAVLVFSRSSWGEAMKGVQVRLQADNSSWRVGEIPTFTADVRNKGKLPLKLTGSQEDCQIEVNGKWYRLIPPYGGRVYDFSPGAERKGIPIRLTERWMTLVNDEELINSPSDGILGPDARSPLLLKPGKYTVRVAFNLEPANMKIFMGLSRQVARQRSSWLKRIYSRFIKPKPGENTPFARPVSKPVEIEIRSADTKYERKLRFSVKVLGLDGKPKRHARVYCDRTDRKLDRKFSYSRLSNDDGIADFNDVITTPGLHTICALAEFTNQPYDAGITQVSIDQTDTVIELKLKETGYLRGVITDSNGSPIQYARVTPAPVLKDFRGDLNVPRFTGQTDATGKYAILAIRGLEYKLRISSKQGSFTIEPPDPRCRLAIKNHKKTVTKEK